ncbi:MAG: FG-GAP-like repeat-containing protein [Planctomycetota bacterium]
MLQPKTATFRTSSRPRVRWLTLGLGTICLALAACKPTESRVTGVLPAPGAVAAADVNTVTIAFDRPMQASTINTETFRVTGSDSGNHLGVIAYNASKQEATYVVERAFTAGETVTVALSDRVLSLSGKKLKQFVSTFTVYATPVIPPTPFTLDSMSPTFEATDAPRLTAIQLAYSSPFNPFTVGASTIQVIGERSGLRTLTFDNVFGGTGNVRFTVDRAFLAGERIHIAVNSLASIQMVTAPAALLAFTAANVASEWPAAPLATLPATTETRVHLVDLDRDGRDEWLLVDATGAVSVQGLDSGTVSTPTTLLLPRPVVDSVVGDFNGDGRMDLACLAASRDRIDYLLGSATASTFGAVQTIDFGPYLAGRLGVDHFDGDRFPDLFLVPATAEAGARILAGSGSVPFAASRSVTTLMAVAPAVSADFDGDDFPDLACAVADGSVQILFGSSAGTFRTGPTLASGASVSAVSRANLNGDAFADLLCWNDTGVAGRAFITEGGGVFTEVALPIDASAPTTTVADWNGDGDMDLLSFAAASAEVTIFAGQGDGTFATATVQTTSAPLAQLALGDVNGDGSLDVALLLETGDLEIGHGTPVVPSIDNIVRVEDVQANAGDTGVGIVVTADHNVVLDGFTLVLGYDPSRLTLDAITTAGTNAGNIGVEFEIPQIDNVQGVAILAAIFDFLPPYDGQQLAPATDHVIAVGTASIAATAPTGDTTLAPSNDLGTPSADTIFVVAGISVDPQLEAGTVSITASTPPTGATFLRGDVNQDGAVDIADGTRLVNYLFSGAAAPTCLDAADVNDDGVVDISDSTYLNNFLFGVGAAPALPFPTADVDPTADALSCGP